MKSKLGDKVRLQHILDAIELIDKSLINKTEDNFQEDFYFAGCDSTMGGNNR